MTTRRSLWVIAMEIWADWKNPWCGATPYLEAMTLIESINDMHGRDSARSIVTHFLCNATKWRGDKARTIKAELKAMLKG